MDESRVDRPFFTVVMPVYNGGPAFEACLRALRQSRFRDWQLIVVDDGSNDGSDDIAAAYGAEVFHTTGRTGPGCARNQGATHATGKFLLFLDADCQVNPDTLANAASHLQSDSGLDALFGSYDDDPVAPSLVSRYKNLQHHFVHQNGNEDASTFWAGCGAVRRSVFVDVGGFDLERYPRPSIEDIELGYRLRGAGHRIKLAKDVQVKHHKQWTLSNLIKTDVFDRGIPWTTLLLTNKQAVKDLNLGSQGRASVVAAVALLICCFLVLVDWRFLLAAIGFAIVLLGLNSSMYLFYYRRGGLLFAIGCLGLHWMYFLYCAFAFVAGHFTVLWNRVRGSAGGSHELVSK